MLFLTTHQHSIYIDAPPEMVWQLANDIARYPEWVEATIEIIKYDPVAASGAVYVERTRIAGPITTRSRWTITEFDQKHMVQRHVGDDLPGLRDLWVQLQVQPHGRGAHFTLALGFTVSMGPLSRPVGAWLKRTFGAGNVRNVQQFARIAEALAAESAV